MEHIVSRDDGLKQIEQPRFPQMPMRMGLARRCCNRCRNAALAQLADQLARPLLDGNTAMAALAHHDAATFVKQRIGERHAIGFHQQLIGSLMAAADHGHMHRISHLEPQFGADLKDDGAENALGVEQGAVHVEDDGLERLEPKDVGRKLHGFPV